MHAYAGQDRPAKKKLEREVKVEPSRSAQPNAALSACMHACVCIGVHALDRDDLPGPNKNNGPENHHPSIILVAAPTNTMFADLCYILGAIPVSS